MIRLAVTGDESAWQTAALRLHGGTVTCCFDAARATPPNDCDGLIFVEATCSAISLIRQSLSDGYHVLLATASWLSSDVLESLSDASKSGTQLAVINPDQFLPSRQLIRQQLEAGKLGVPGLIRMHRWEELSAEPPDTLSDLPSPLACDIELAVSLIGSPPTFVYATEASPPDSRSGNGRTIQIHLGFATGGMALIDYSNALPPGAGYQSLSVIGSAGAAYADDHQNMQLLYQGNHPRAMRTDEGVRQLVNLAQDFVDALQAKRDLSPSITNWRNTLNVMSAVEQSLKSRQAVSMEGR